MSTIRVLFLGPAQQHTGIADVEVPLPDPPTLATLRRIISESYPMLRAALPTMRWAVNLAYATDDTPLSPGDEVAFIPPVSGGCPDDRLWIELIRAPLPVLRVRAFIGGDAAHGALAIFEGVTRAESDPQHGTLLRLEYEAYEPMALSEMRRLADAALERWSVGKIALLHRFGTVSPGETSLIIAVASGHRAEAFDACRWLIDALKKDVPIWKKDVFADGFARWIVPARL